MSLGSACRRETIRKKGIEKTRTMFLGRHHGVYLTNTIYIIIIARGSTLRMRIPSIEVSQS